MDFDDVAALAEDDMQAVNRLISASLESDVPLVSQVSEYIVMSGGKRLRPLIVLLAARAMGYDGEQHIRAAAIIEFIHTATLLHDDVVDSSERRRGQDSANTVFGNQASVLVGDFLYSRSFQMMVDIGDMRVMQILADATNTIAAGEVMQLMNVHDPDTSEDDYQQVIYRKTARLFEAGAQIAAVLANRDPGDEAAMIKYGQHLGTAFQLIDDALDYSASADELGKNLGDDLAEGKATLPLIYAMRAGTDAQRDLIREAFSTAASSKWMRSRKSSMRRAPSTTQPRKHARPQTRPSPLSMHPGHRVPPGADVTGRVCNPAALIDGPLQYALAGHCRRHLHNTD